MNQLNNFTNTINNIDFNGIFSYFISSRIHETLLPFKIAFLIISGILVGIMIFITLRTHYLQWLFVQDWVQFVTMKPLGARKITRQWNKILRRLETGTEAEYKLAVIEADDMLDAALKKMGYLGQTFEERLGKLTSATLPNIEQLHEIHNLRNNIVRNPDYRLTLDEAKKATDVYGRAFRDLQILGE